MYKKLVRHSLTSDGNVHKKVGYLKQSIQRPSNKKIISFYREFQYSNLLS